MEQGERHPRNFFFILSPGRSGSKCLASILGLARNAMVLHEPGSMLSKDSRRAVTLYRFDRKTFLESPDAAWPEFEGKLRELSNPAYHAYKEVYGQSHAGIYPFLVHLHMRLGERVKFVWLLRNPVEAVSTIARRETLLTVHGDLRFRTASFHSAYPAELWSSQADPILAAAELWLSINTVILEQLNIIGKSRWMPIQAESMRHGHVVSQIYSWLGLEGFDAGPVERGSMDSWNVNSKLSGEETFAVNQNERNRIRDYLGQRMERIRQISGLPLEF